MLILPAAPAGAVSGQQDKSIVYFGWRGNQSARSYAMPANPKTANQQIVRNSLASLASSWSTLTEAERLSWTNYAQNHQTRDRMGRPVTPTGLNWYIKANSNRLYQGLAAVATAPAAPPPAPLTDLSADAFLAPNGIDVMFTAPGAAGLQVRAQIEPTPTPAWTPSINRSRLIAGPTADSYKTVPTTGTATITWISTTPFSNGQQVALWVSVIRTADGTESIPFLVTAIATI